LESIIDACSKPKIKSKNKPVVVLQDEMYLDHYLELLFTEEEKRLMQTLIDSNFQQESEEKAEV
jgi:hypothetical protein